MVKRRGLFARLFAPLGIVFAYLFLYLPMIVLVLFSFNDSALPGHWGGFSLRWYATLFSLPELANALWATLIVASFSTVLSLALGTSLVYATKWLRAPLHVQFYANVLVPEILLGVGLLSVFAWFSMPLGYSSLVAGHTILGLGFVVPIVRSRFLELDPHLGEASADLGASEWQTFRLVMIPMLLPALLASALLVFTISLDDFLIAFFCSSPTVQTLSIYIYSMVREGVDPRINAISTLLLLASSVLVLLLSTMRVLDQVITHD